MMMLENKKKKTIPFFLFFVKEAKTIKKLEDSGNGKFFSYNFYHSPG